MAGMNEDQMKLVQDLEVEMMSDMYTRMTNACHLKCIPTKFKDGELGKGEAVCIDRWDINIYVKNSSSWRILLKNSNCFF